MAFNLVDTFFVEVEVRGRAQGQTILNILHYRVINLEGAVESTDALVAVNALWLAEFIPLLHTAYTHQTTFIRTVEDLVLGVEGDPRLVYGFVDERPPSPIPGGGDGSDGLPTYVTVNAYKRSAGTLTTDYHPRVPSPVIPTEKLYKGRVGVGSLGEGVTAPAGGNELTALARTNFQDAVDTLTEIAVDVSPGNRCDLALQILSMFRNGAVRPAAGGLRTMAFQLADSILVQPNVGTQNSRKAKNVV